MAILMRFAEGDSDEIDSILFSRDSSSVLLFHSASSFLIQKSKIVYSYRRKFYFNWNFKSLNKYINNTVNLSI